MSCNSYLWSCAFGGVGHLQRAGWLSSISVWLSSHSGILQILNISSNIKGCFSFSGLLMDHRLCLSFYAPWLINISWCQGVSESEVCRDRFPAVQEGGTLCMPNAKARTTSLSVKAGWETIGHSCKPQTIHKRCLYRVCLCALCRSSPLCSLYWVIKERRLKSPAFVGDDVLLSTLCMILQFLIIASEIKYFGLL